jgi:DNA-binding NarL/FixJ family response regulator
VNTENNNNRRPRVFVVDDDDRMLRAVERVLGRECSIVGTARNGALAIPAILKLQPEIVLMDMMMPEMSGPEACLRLRQCGSKAKILLTSLADDPAIHEAAMKSGGDGFLSKLRLDDELRQTVFAMLRGQPPVRVLVVDDYEPFRHFVCATLAQNPELQVVGEASDGLEAVHKAQDLQPALIVLDIGLPTLNGIEAARRIRKLSPDSKILFVSQENSPDVVHGVLSLGALGYVVKSHAGRELLAAVATVLEDRQFVSSGLAGNHSSKVPDRPLHKEVLPPPVPKAWEITRRHEAQFHSDDARLLDGFTSFVLAALKAGNAVIIVATESHRDSLFLRLQADDLDIGAALEQGRYISLDAAETLSTFMVNGLPDPARFLKVTSDLIVEAAKAVKGEQARVSACGECAPLLWAQGKADAAIRLEHLWDEIAKSYGVDVLCGYPLASFQGGFGSYIFDKICAEHSVARSL